MYIHTNTYIHIYVCIYTQTYIKYTTLYDLYVADAGLTSNTEYGLLRTSGVSLSTQPGVSPEHPEHPHTQVGLLTSRTVH